MLNKRLSIVIVVCLLIGSAYAIEISLNKDTVTQLSLNKFVLPTFKELNEKMRLDMKDSLYILQTQTKTEENLEKEILSKRCYNIYVKDGKLITEFTTEGTYCLSEKEWIEYLKLEGLYTGDIKNEKA